MGYFFLQPITITALKSEITASSWHDARLQSKGAGLAYQLVLYRLRACGKEFMKYYPIDE